MSTDENVLGTALESCSVAPETGYLRDGHCRHLADDRGRHEMCAVVTQEFLEFSRERGNDLVTPRPEFDFPGLHPGDRWCVCVGRWLEAYEADCAPPLVLEATSGAVLDDVPLELLREYAADHDGDADDGDAADRDD
jgi:hypothetical protein